MENQKKLFYYNLPAVLGEKFDSNKCFAISEIELPEPSKKYDRICAIDCEKIPEYIPLGSNVSIATGDPIILDGKETKILSREINHTDPNIPDELKTLGKKYPPHGNIYTFEYKGERVWIIKDFVCLLDDLEKEYKKFEKKEPE